MADLNINKSDTTKTIESFNVPALNFSGRLWSSGVEQQDLTTNASFISNREFDVVRNATVSTSVFRPGGLASANINVTNSKGDLGKQVCANIYQGKLFARGYLYLAALPTSISTSIGGNNSDVTIIGFNDNSSVWAELTIDASGVLRMYQDGSSRAVIATSAALNLNTWYRVEVAYGAGNNYVEFLLNGVSQGSTYAAPGLQGVLRVDYGFSLLTGESGTVNMYWDDMAINCDTGSYQNSWPGAGQIVNLIPANPGDNNAFSINVGGTPGQVNNYTRVNSSGPINDTKYNGEVFAGDIDDFAVTPTPATISSGDTINVVHLGIRYRVSVVNTKAGLNARIKKTAMGTLAIGSIPNILSTSFINYSATSANYPYSYPITLYNDPDGNPWAKSTLDSAQIGYELLTLLLTTEVDVSDVWLVVDSTPGNSDLDVNVADTTVTSESPDPDLSDNAVNVSDTTTTSESVNAEQEDTLGVSDTTVTSENITVGPPLSEILDDPADTAITTEDVTVLIPLAGNLYINTLDSVKVTESPSETVISQPFSGPFGPLVFTIKALPNSFKILKTNPNDP